MTIDSLPRVDDELLHGWLDGELDAAERSRVEAWLRDHPEEAARVRLWAADRDALRVALSATLDEPVPLQMQRMVLQRRSGWRLDRALALRVASAATLLLVGGLLGAWITRSGALEPRGEAWLARAALAHAVYVPEQRHPVEVSVLGASDARAQEDHLQKWLTKRLALPVTLFDLQPEGFALVGGRLLPESNGPCAQLMYQNEQGQRVTVYLRKPERDTPAAFRYERDGDLGMFYWVENQGAASTGYALVGALPRARLLALAEAIYKQSAAR
jgi:anti-sigma factor RsiW